MAKPLDGFWIGAGYQRDRATIRSLGFSVPTFCFSREEREMLEMELLIGYAYMKKPP